MINWVKTIGLENDIVVVIKNSTNLKFEIKKIKKQMTQLDQNWHTNTFLVFFAQNVTKICTIIEKSHVLTKIFIFVIKFAPIGTLFQRIQTKICTI